MRARTAVTAAALAASAALTLTACGGGGSGDGDKIATAPTTATTAAPSPAATTPAADASLRTDPSLTLPADLKLTFEWPLPSDHTRAAVLTATANYMQAMDHGVAKRTDKDPVLTAFGSGAALSFSRSYVQQYVSHGWTLTGTDRFYRPKVEIGSDRESGQVTFCENQSRIYGKEVKTGKVLTTPESESSYVSYVVALAKLPTRTEVWQAQSITVTEKALACKQ